MKTTKKLLAMLLALTMILSLAVAVSADDTATGTITINNAYANTTYTAYQLFTISFDANGNEIYTVNAAWKDFFTDSNAGATYFTLDETGILTPIATEGENVLSNNAAAFANAAVAYASTNSIAVYSTKKTEANATSVTFSNLPYGYYAVASGAGTKGAVLVSDATPNTNIKEKNALPSIEKTMSSGTYGVGDDVNFTITVTVEAGGINYVVHDYMGNGLNFNSTSVVVKKDNTTVDTSKYSVVTEKDSNYCSSKNCTFEIRFNNDYIATLGTGDKLVITYTATMQSTGDYTNSASISSGEDNPDEPSPSTIVNPSTFTLTKTDGTATLDGAEFVIYKMVGSVKKYATFAFSEDVYTLTGWNDTTGTTITAGSVTIKGLPAGESGTEIVYYLEETKAPDNYNKLTSPIEVKVTSQTTTDKTTKVTTTTHYVNGKTNTVVTVVNSTSSTLPETGGMGTTIFYVLGGILMLAAVVVLVSKKRMTAE